MLRVKKERRRKLVTHWLRREPTSELKQRVGFLETEARRREVEPDYKIVARLLLLLLLTPFKVIYHLLMALLNLLFARASHKRGLVSQNIAMVARDLHAPLGTCFQGFIQARFAIVLLVANTTAFLLSLFLDPGLLDKLMLHSLYFKALDFKWIAISSFSSMFLHANIYHLAANLAGIYIFSRVVERELGHFRAALIYFGAGVFSAVFSNTIYALFASKDVVSLGASGAIMGLVAAAILLRPLTLVLGLIPVAVLGLLQIYTDISGIIRPSPADNVGRLAHLGGYLAISFMLFLFTAGEKQRMKKGLMINIGIVVLYLLLVYLGGLRYISFSLY